MVTWNEFQSRFYFDRKQNFSLDYSRVGLTEDTWKSLENDITRSFKEMAELEKGAIANQDEKRMVGHYWLRAAELAPTAEIKDQIGGTLNHIREFASHVHSGRIANARGEKFKHLLVIGIGGSALGPQFVSNALRTPNDPLDLYFFDNTDPDGMNRVLDSIPDLSKTLCIVVSKSGGTKETRNGQVIAKEMFSKKGLSLSHHFVAITGEGSELDKTAIAEKWCARFPMWDWVGGRTSEFSAVGLLPAALQGFDIISMLAGAKAMDDLTRVDRALENPAMILAVCWHSIGGGKGSKDMVILPYKDRIELLSRYLQQLVMESLGKESDRDGKKVHQGIAVYGNKGSTDQHAYVQQLRDGVNNFFATFIEVLEDGADGIANKFEVEPYITSGDYLSGFFQGTRKALFESNRKSITVTVQRADAFTIGMLIALFERAVGFYASLVNINAYHQPGVEAGKKAAGEVLKIQLEVLQSLKGTPQSAAQIASTIGKEAETETVFRILRRLSASGRAKVEVGKTVFEDRYFGV